MFNHSSENNAFFDFDMINKNLYVATREDISEGINLLTSSFTLSGFEILNYATVLINSWLVPRRFQNFLFLRNDIWKNFQEPFTMT